MIKWKLKCFDLNTANSYGMIKKLKYMIKWAGKANPVEVKITNFLYPDYGNITGTLRESW